MTKVLFVSAVDPYSFRETAYPPLWPAFLAAYTASKKPSNGLSFAYDVGPAKAVLRRHKPDILALSAVTQNYEIAEDFAAAARAKKIKVVIGGMHISSLPYSLTRNMDVACIGEGEETFTALLDAYTEDRALRPDVLRKIPGVAFHDGDELVTTRPRPLLHDLDALPHPDRRLIGYGHRGYVYTARGCTYKCVFCACHKFWGSVRYASAGYIMEELTELARNGTRVVRFADENFVSNGRRLEEIASLFRQKRLDRELRCSCWVRANNVNPDVVKLLRSMNVVSVKLGLESGAQRTLDYLKGSVSVEQNAEAVRLLKDGGMQVNADFIFGAPDESLEDIHATYEFIRRVPIDFFDVNIFSPLPGTPVWEMAKNRGLVDDRRMEWSRLNFKFASSESKAIHLSNHLNHRQLRQAHGRFTRLRLLRMLRALPRSPWLDELPRVAVRAVRLKCQAAAELL